MTPAAPVQRAASRHRIRLASGVNWERLTTLSEPGIEFLHVTYEVGGASSPPDAFQRHPGHEWGYVLSGRLQVQIGFDEYVLEPGDAISINSTIPHRLATIGDRAGRGHLVRPGSGPVRRPDPHRGAPDRPGLIGALPPGPRWGAASGPNPCVARTAADRNRLPGSNRLSGPEPSPKRSPSAR